MMTPSRSSPNSGSMFRVRSLAQAERDWNADENRATNCDYKGCEVNDNVVVDDYKVPIEYNCEHFFEFNLSSTSDTLEETQVIVDYEAMIPISADLDTNERQLQWSILLAAAKGTGLDTCTFDRQQWGEGDRQLHPVLDIATRSTSLSSTTTTTTPILYAMRSDLKASSFLDFSCSKLESNANTKCVPVRSVVTLMYFGNQTQGQELQDEVQDLLEESLTNRTQEMYVSDVEGLRYVGTFDFVSTAPTNGGGDAVIRIGTLISSASAVLLVITIFFFRWPKRDSNENNEHQRHVHGKTEVDLHSLESGRIASTMPTNSSSESNLGNSTDGLAGGPSNESMMTEQRSADDHDHPTVADTGYFASRSSDSGDHVTAALETPFPLPPRPPRRGESVQLKVARRPRKKKKKRQTLKRVNSREHVNSMEAIPETVHEVCLVDSGSEYSSDDDASSNFSSSTNTSPVRMRSLPGSRSGSPSPLDLPPDLMASNFNFIIDCEAMEFPFDSNNDILASTSSTSVSDGQVPSQLRTSSPVKEQRKIRPIPPPWL